MKITCTKLLNPKIRKHVIEVCKFTVSNTFTKRQLSKLESISIRINNSMGKDDDMMAFMDIDLDDGTENKPTRFIIWLCPSFTKKNVNTYKNLLMETIIHETIHIRQYLSGALKQIHRNGAPIMKFNKRYYKITNSHRNYWLAPWEIEARGYERGVLNLYCEENRCYDQFPDTSFHNIK